jgi:tetratricopeptide (TPR) repeat protein
MSKTTYREQIYQSFIKGDMIEWEKQMNLMKSNLNNQSLEYELELMDYYYGYIAWSIGKKYNSKAEKALDFAEDRIDAILEKQPKLAKALALKGAFIGFRIGLNKLKAVYLGPRSQRYINEAVASNPNEPQSWIEKGNMLYYMPRIFGGSESEAIICYQKALQLLEKDERILENNWMYLNLYVVIAKAHQESGNIDEAQKIYKKLLAIEPDFQWVKKELYPDVLEKSK